MTDHEIDPGDSERARMLAKIHELQKQVVDAQRRLADQKPFREWSDKRAWQVLETISGMIGILDAVARDERCPDWVKAKMEQATALYEPPTYSDGGKMVEMPHAEVERLRAALAEVTKERDELAAEAEEMHAAISALNVELAGQSVAAIDGAKPR